MIIRTFLKIVFAGCACTILFWCEVSNAVGERDGKQHEPQAPKVIVDARGAVHLPAITIPFSLLASREAKENFLDIIRGFAALSEVRGKKGDINALREELDDLLMQPGVTKLRAAFPVTVRQEVVGGVQTDIIEPVEGIAEKNKRRVLINLHGGGFVLAAGLGGQMESIPIASLGRIKVITVDYREAPEYRFPAASEDVARVYGEILHRGYPAGNVGIYGCSAGGTLAAESVAWFQTHELPRPGAIGMFGAGAVVPMVGDSSYFGSVLTGNLPASAKPSKFSTYFDVPQINIRDPLVSPVYSPSVLAAFPPSLLISGTRDIGLSPVAYTHARLTKYGVPAELHVWEGATHCSFAQPVVDPRVPETQEAWEVIVNFFDKHLGD